MFKLLKRIKQAAPKGSRGCAGSQLQSVQKEAGVTDSIPEYQPPLVVPDVPNPSAWLQDTLTAVFGIEGLAEQVVPSQYNRTEHHLKGQHCSLNGSVACVLVSWIPAAISTEWGNKWALSVLNNFMPGRVEIVQFNVPLFGAISAKCIKVYEPNGAWLMHINDLKLSCGLYGLLSGSNYDAHLDRPTFNCAYDKEKNEFRLPRWLQAAGLVSSGNATVQAADNKANPEKQAAAILTSVSHEVDSLSRQATAPPTPESAASHTSSQPNKEAEQPVAQSAPTGFRPTTHPASSSSSSGSATAQAASKVAKQYGVTAEGRYEPRSVGEVLSRVNASMEFWVDMQLPKARVIVTDGRLLVPQEVRDVLGPKIMLTGATGISEVREWADKVGVPFDWMMPLPPEVDTDTYTQRAFKPPKLIADWARHLPEKVRLKWWFYEPCMIMVSSKHMVGGLRGWLNVSGKGGMVLHDPAWCDVEFSPQLCRLGLSFANPLLKDVVDMRGSDSRLQIDWSPEDLELPGQSHLVRVSPVSLTLRQSPLLTQLLSSLKLDQSLPISPRTLELEARMTAMEMLFKDGLMRTKRVDMLLGPSGVQWSKQQPVHLAIWGDSDATSGALDVVLGLPASMLRPLGLTDLPPKYVLPVKVKGTLDKPSLQVSDAAKRLAKLYVWQQVLNKRKWFAPGPATSGQRQWLNTMMESLDAAAQKASWQLDAELQFELSKIPRAPKFLDTQVPPAQAGQIPVRPSNPTLGTAPTPSK